MPEFAATEVAAARVECPVYDSSTPACWMAVHNHLQTVWLETGLCVFTYDNNSCFPWRRLLVLVKYWLRHCTTQTAGFWLYLCNTICLGGWHGLAFLTCIGIVNLHVSGFMSAQDKSSAASSCARAAVVNARRTVSFNVIAFNERLAKGS
jgi:hypothetical protein